VALSKDFRRSDLVMASDVTLPAPGAYLGVAMVSAQTIEMKGHEFTDYLKEESSRLSTWSVWHSLPKPNGRATG
jgi:hypothetical protein